MLYVQLACVMAMHTALVNAIQFFPQFLYGFSNSSLVAMIHFTSSEVGSLQFASALINSEVSLF